MSEANSSSAASSSSADAPPPTAAEPSSLGPLLTRATRLGCLLFAEGAALLLGGCSLVLGDVSTAILEANRYPKGLRTRLVIWFGALLVLALGGLIGLVRRRSEALWAGAETWARRLAPIIPLATVPSLLETKFWFTHPLEFLLVLAAVSLVAERTFRVSFATFERPWPSLLDHPRLPLILVCTAAASYVAYTGYLTVLNHQRFGTGAYDLAIFDNMSWNALHGEPYRSTVMFGDRPGNALADHAHFGMLLFLPFYAVYPRAESLLILQAALLGGAAIPLFAFARTQLSAWSSALIALCYLLSPLVHGAQFYDFHWLPLAVFFHFLLFYAIAKDKLALLVPSLIVLFSLREDVAPGLAIVGLFLVLTGARPKLGAVLALVSGVWFGIVKFVIMPWAGTWWFADMYKELVAPGEKGFGSILRTLLLNPVFVLRTLLTEAKFEYLLHAFVPLALLPLRSMPLALLAVPGFFFTILTSWRPAYSINYQYTTHLVPYTFAASVLFLRMAERGELLNRPAALLSQPLVHARSALAALVLATVCHSAVFGVVLYPSSFVGMLPVHFSLDADERVRLERLRRLIAQIPPNASVSATDIEAPHLSNRRDLYALAQDQTAGEYLLLAASSFHQARTRENVRAILARHPYGFVAREGNMTLWRRGAQNERTEAELTQLRLELRHR
ncbi:MAG TPA: DUF2079 domain-containing protein [Polyangiaceae bacterium]|nr:DUF2079 domain-containing protein [Polyangiaceae bacterium]